MLVAHLLRSKLGTRGNGTKLRSLTIHRKGVKSKSIFTGAASSYTASLGSLFSAMSPEAARVLEGQDLMSDHDSPTSKARYQPAFACTEFTLCRDMLRVLITGAVS